MANECQGGCIVRCWYLFHDSRTCTAASLQPRYSQDDGKDMIHTRTTGSTVVYCILWSGGQDRSSYFLALSRNCESDDVVLQYCWLVF